ncbi:MAG: succinylglutamate desuccinylase/aspartoacylase family protein [Planctomycetota bacterium]
MIDIPLSFLADHTRMHLTMQVLNGKQAGPTVFVSAAIHGDEIIGVEIIRRLTEVKALNRLRGTLILAPVVNAYGFIALSRYLPDRRDLNRSFPGSETGSLASQLAHTFMTEIVERCEYGVDLHSGAVHRANLPQIRACLDNPLVEGMAEAFGASIMLHSNLRDGSLREAAQDVGCNMLLYEAGEALRFDEAAIRIGVRGVLGVLRHVGALPKSRSRAKRPAGIRAESSHWLRAPMGGILRTMKPLGAQVGTGETLGVISDPLGRSSKDVIARRDGFVIGRLNLPIVNRGDALFHIACVDSLDDAEEAIAAVEEAVEKEPLFDGMEII